MADSYKGEYRAVKHGHDGMATAVGSDPCGPQTNSPGPGDNMGKMGKAATPVYLNVSNRQKTGG
jgi:hypothetical protein